MQNSLVNRVQTDASRRHRYAAVVAYALVVLVASVVDPGTAPETTAGVGTTALLHVVGYAGLAIIVGYALGRDDRRALLLAVAIPTLYGGGIELFQSGLAHRTMASTDVLLNGVGAALGAACWLAVGPGHPDEA